MKNKSILELANGLAICGDFKGKLGYAVARNNRTLQPILEVFTDMLKKIYVDNAKKGEDGKPLMEKGKNEVGQEIDKYKIEDQEKFDKDYKELLDIETEVTLHKIKSADLPKDKDGNLDITAKQYTGIFQIIEE